MSDQLAGVLRGLFIIGMLLVIGALIDFYRKKRSPGPRQPKKLTRREAFWIIIIVVILVLHGIPVGSFITPLPPDNRPVTISQ